MLRDKKGIPLLLVWLTLTSTAPFIFYLWPYHPYKALTFFCLISMIIFFLYKKQKRLLLDRNILIILLVQIAYYLITSFIFHNYSNLNFILQFIALFIIILFIDNFLGFELLAKSYIKVILIMGIGGVIIFFLHLIIGISPIFQCKYSATGTSYFFGITTTNDYFNYGGLRIIRYSGFFDEPGAFGLFALFAILINKVYFNDLRTEIYLITITIFTLSIAFLIIITFYIILFYFKLSYFKYLLLPALIVFFIVIKLSNYNGTNASVKALKEMTVDRLKITEKGNLAGDNRYESTQHDKKVFFNHPLIGVQKDGMVRGNNFYSIIAKNGLIGSAFYYAFLVYFLIIILKLRGEEQLFYFKILFVIVANFFHRPDFSAVLTLLLIYTILKYPAYYKKEVRIDHLIVY